jgi:HEAT repeat protein
VKELYNLRDAWDDFGQENVDRFLALPRATFIEDLRTVLRDVVIRNEELTEDGETDSYVFYHAIGFLGVLEAKEALPDLLNTLRTDEDFIDVYYGMQTEEILYVPLCLLGKNQPQVLYDFVIEENNEGYTRASVAEAFALIALHDPARTQEIVGYYQRLFRHLLDNAD